MNRGLIIAAPASGSGKTTLTLGILRALSRRGVAVRGAKSGPDYIDTRFHQAACGEVCKNLDAWAMPETRLLDLVQGRGTLIIEGAMGLFDGAPPQGKGATADLARLLQIPVLLVVDGSHMAQSVAALVAGFAQHDPQVKVAGIILNKIGSPRHETMLRTALAPLGIPILGAVHRQKALAHPSRHLGLVQAEERADLDTFLDQAGDIVETALELEKLMALSAPLPGASDQTTRLAPPAQSIAIARDAAFRFAYPHILEDWRRAGATLSFFSPLANEAPAPCDLVFLPGGYPELHAGRLAGAETFRAGMARAAKDGAVYGECGGYMVMGDGLWDADGTRHAMLGLLPLETSFAKRQLHLGYRQLSALGGPFQGLFTGHEFHYATTLRAEGPPLFAAQDAQGQDLPAMGLRHGRLTGSFAHLIDRVI